VKVENGRKKSEFSSWNSEEQDLRPPVYLNSLIFRREVVICLILNALVCIADATYYKEK